MQIGKEMAIPSILKIGNGALGKIGGYLKAENLDQVVLFFGNGLIDMFGELVMNSLKEVREKYDLDAAKFRYILSPSEFTTEKFTSAWNLKQAGKENAVLQEGYPRNDYLLNHTPEDVEQVKRALHIMPEDIGGRKIVLYAPTWRDNQHDSADGYSYQLGVDFARLRQALGEECIILFRAHYLVANQFDFAEGEITYLSRADGFANYDEATAAPATYEMSDEVKAGFENCFTYTESGYEKDEDPNAEDITTGAKNGLKLADLRGVDYNDSKWDDLLDEMSIDDLQQTIGFGGEVKSKTEASAGSLYAQVEPHDIIKFGLIPELVGRIPVIAALDDLDKEALVRILRDPKNAIVKQYRKLFGLDRIRLVFDEDALDAIAEEALQRHTGARGLRAIMEQYLMKLMYELPSDDTAESVTITRAFICGEGQPLITHRAPAAAALPEAADAIAVPEQAPVAQIPPARQNNA